MNTNLKIKPRKIYKPTDKKSNLNKDNKVKLPGLEESMV